LCLGLQRCLLLGLLAFGLEPLRFPTLGLPSGGFSMHCRQTGGFQLLRFELCRGLAPGPLAFGLQPGSFHARCLLAHRLFLLRLAFGFQSFRLRARRLRLRYGSALGFQPCEFSALCLQTGSFLPLCLELCSGYAAGLLACGLEALGFPLLGLEPFGFEKRGLFARGLFPLRLQLRCQLAFGLQPFGFGPIHLLASLLLPLTFELCDGLALGFFALSLMPLRLLAFGLQPGCFDVCGFLSGRFFLLCLELRRRLPREFLVVGFQLHGLHQRRISACHFLTLCFTLSSRFLCRILTLRFLSGRFDACGLLTFCVQPCHLGACRLPALGFKPGGLKACGLFASSEFLLHLSLRCLSCGFHAFSLKLRRRQARCFLSRGLLPLRFLLLFHLSQTFSRRRC
jgi:hypothetical protein